MATSIPAVARNTRFRSCPGGIVHLCLRGSHSTSILLCEAAITIRLYYMHELICPWKFALSLLREAGKKIFS